MSDLISREAVLSLKTIAPIAPVMNGEAVHYEEVVFVRDLEKLSSAEPERKKGKWIEGEKTSGYIKWNCSECGLLVRNSQKPWYEYCPKCGTEMEVEN